jgi:hypothetical protein
MAITRQESTSGSDMEITPRIQDIPTITTNAHNTEGETNVLALQPYIPAEPTLLEITKPEVSFEELSS